MSTRSSPKSGFKSVLLHPFRSMRRKIRNEPQTGKNTDPFSSRLFLVDNLHQPSLERINKISELESKPNNTSLSWKSIKSASFRKRRKSSKQTACTERNDGPFFDWNKVALTEKVITTDQRNSPKTSFIRERFSSVRRSARRKIRNAFISYGESMMYATDGSPHYEINPMRSRDYYYWDDENYYHDPWGTPV